ncbi:M24 family metallopeptidase [Streptomyces sp. NPDC096339]|uniref:M24 family metallopeptidase n=1 Tax=Streptomyces sp. NPDC096339 TaxID=3366086 RepID=UPI00380CFF82
MTRVAVPDRMDKRLRALGLVEAHRMARAVFAEVTGRGLVLPGRTERELDARVWDVAAEVFPFVGQRRGRLVRSGPHAVVPSGGHQEATDRVICRDDVVVIDLGALLAVRETDFARTVVVGDDPGRIQLVADLAAVAAGAREAFVGNEDITGRELHAEIEALAGKAGWSLGTWHVGRLSGAAVPRPGHGTRRDLFIGPDNTDPLRRTVVGGWWAHWILEVCLVDDYDAGLGGSFKQLLGLA